MHLNAYNLVYKVVSYRFGAALAATRQLVGCIKQLIDCLFINR